MIKVAILDSHVMISQAMRALCSPPSGGLAYTSDCGAADVILVGVDDGFDVLVSQRDRPCVAFGRRCSAGFAARAIMAGARAYMSTAHNLELLLALIITVAGSTTPVMSEEVMASVKAGGPTGSLSPRELRVMGLLIDGKTCREIGALLQVSVKTVDTQRGSILSKLGLNGVPALVRFALRYGFINPEP
jgi:DNA-binding NarL/FixJ family response regulator